MSDTPALYDRNGIPIMPGDTLKVFHYTPGALSEGRYMYKWVAAAVHPNNQPLLRISNLGLDGGFYWELMDGRTLEQAEIVQGYEGVKPGEDYRDRVRKAK